MSSTLPFCYPSFLFSSFDILNSKQKKKKRKRRKRQKYKKNWGQKKTEILNNASWFFVSLPNTDKSNNSDNSTSLKLYHQIKISFQNTNYPLVFFLPSILTSVKDGFQRKFNYLIDNTSRSATASAAAAAVKQVSTTATKNATTTKCNTDG